MTRSTYRGRVQCTVKSLGCWWRAATARGARGGGCFSGAVLIRGVSAVQAQFHGERLLLASSFALKRIFKMTLLLK